MPANPDDDLHTKLKKVRHDAKLDSLDIQSNFLATLRSRHLHWASLARNSESAQIHMEIANLIQ
jgi:hypothetical protein